ncbi:hypothetical protein BDY19DRAFT_995312 [Irpex rosettiformis]|uniref:Uncharacterized protein n=1 Tax=Irpex rosettiformis TaxID=378272 RepID=A0ACB8TZJ1_9APHY|nr:hypothetical protein BDY19DRAFT_995312 [Irpex rosettiformis]
MIIVYDHVVTLDQEIDLIWKAGWSFGKCLFLLNRYYALFVVVFNNYGAHWFRWQAATGIVAFIFGELILQLRLLALYNLNRKVLALMACTFAIALSVASAIVGVALSRVNVVSISLQLTNLSASLCAVTNLDSVSFLYSFWIPMMVSESLLCTLVVIRAVERMREDRRAKRKFTWVENGRELVIILIRDSILYFLVLFAVYLTNTILFRQQDLIITESAISYAVSLSCVMGSRLCLNVRGIVSEASYHHRADSCTGVLTDRHDLSIPHPSTSSVTSPRTPYSGSQKWPVTVVSQYTLDEGEREELTEYEMMELREMKSNV